MAKTSLIRLCSHTSFRTSFMYVVARPQARLKVTTPAKFS